MTIIRAGGALARAGGSVSRVSGSGGAAKSLVTVDDLTYDGHARITGTNYHTPSMAVRYVGGQRRILTYLRDATYDELVGPLIELAFTGTLSKVNNYAGAPTWTETRRWVNWTNVTHTDHDPALAIFKYHNGSNNGAAPTMFYWDESTNRLWYAWQPNYPGGQKIFPCMAFVYLDNAEARTAGATSGPTVSSGNRSAPYYFSAAALDDHKAATMGVTPIPADRQSSFGGHTFMTTASHNANIGPKGARGMSFYTIPSYPSSTPASLSALFPAADHIYDPSPDSGVTPYGMHRPANSMTKANGHIGLAGIYKVVSGTYSYTAYNATPALPTAVGDCFYGVAKSSGPVDVVTIQMTTPASGGAFVFEYYNGTSWVTPASFATHLGSLAMDSAINVFYFDSVQSVSNVPASGMTNDAWYRFRRTTAGSSGGEILYWVSTSSVIAGSGGTNERPDPVGGFILDKVTACESYGPSSYGYASEDYSAGAAFVSTNNVEGVLAVGQMAGDARWYGMCLLYYRPTSTSGTPIRVADILNGGVGGGGNWSAGPVQSLFYTFDASELAECSAVGKTATRARNPSGLNPKKYYDMRSRYTFSVPRTGHADSNYPTIPNDYQTYFGHAVYFDPTTNQLLVLLNVYGFDSLVLLFTVR